MLFKIGFLSASGAEVVEEADRGLVASKWLRVGVGPEKTEEQSGINSLISSQYMVAIGIVVWNG